MRCAEGSAAACRLLPFADLYAQTWDLWHEGKHDEAMAMHARTLLILTEMLSHGPESVKYVLCLRGVFKTFGLRTGKRRNFLPRQSRPGGSQTGSTSR